MCFPVNSHGSPKVALFDGKLQEDWFRQNEEVIGTESELLHPPRVNAPHDPFGVP
jgi:hypothetical protein